MAPTTLPAHPWTSRSRWSSSSPPAEDLAQKIYTTACLLPDADLHPEDRLQVGREIYRVQTAKEERLYRATTHKVVRLVRHHVG